MAKHHTGKPVLEIIERIASDVDEFFMFMEENFADEQQWSNCGSMYEATIIAFRKLDDRDQLADKIRDYQAGRFIGPYPTVPMSVHGFDPFIIPADEL